MAIPQTNATTVLTTGPAANTEVDVSDALPEAMDVRGDNDPIVSAVTLTGSTDTATALTSIGQGAASDPAAGEVAVVDDTTLAFGDALSSGQVLQITYEARGQGDLPT